MLHLHSIFAYISICLLSIYCVNSNVIEPVKVICLYDCCTVVVDVSMVFL